MRLLLDTHVLLWAMEGSPRLGRRGRDLLTDPANEVWASAASMWEIAIKAALDKLRLVRPLESMCAAIVESGMGTLDVTMRHAALVGSVRLPHSDPFDRLLLAQCEVETLRLVSADRQLADHPAVIGL